MVGAIAVILAIGIPAIVNVVPSAKEETANANLQNLNKGVLKFGQSAWELVLQPNAGSIEDEMLVVRSLQYRNPSVSRATPGSPYVSPNMNLVDSTDQGSYRALWNGRMFELVKPGTQGTGLDLLNMQDSAPAAEFSTDYKPVGAK